jgi:photosystem II stability/assembly factor-like uncharacterized protein
MAVAYAGPRLIAVGSRGLIILSDDHGKTWTQAAVPVQCDLLAAHFPTANEGWVVGHGGVVLHSSDAGKTWSKQLDGRIAADTFKDFYSSMGTAGTGPLHQVEANYKAGAALPFLDVWFEDTANGYAVGSYGQIIATRDGGKTWEPWLHRIDNPQSLNLNAIKGIGGELYIVGERGLIYRLDRARGFFTKTDTQYNGSFFGITGVDGTYIAYGLRGTIYRSGDAGRNWEALPLLSDQTITAGIARSDGEGFVLINAAAQLLLIDKSGKNVRLLPESKPMRATGIASIGVENFVVTGLEGLRTESPQELAVATH